MPWFGAGCCRGSPGCSNYTDDFDRDNSTDLGPDWEEDGDAEISGNTLKITSGKVIFQRKIWDPWGGAIIRPIMKNIQDGDIYRIIINFEGTLGGADESYYYADLTASTVGNVPCKIELYRHENGSDELLATTEPSGDCQEFFYEQPNLVQGSDRQFNLYWGTKYNPALEQAGGMLKAWIGYQDQGQWPAWACAEATGERGKVGLGHGGGPRPIYFDDFLVEDHCLHDSDCPCMSCTCDGVCLDTLYLTIEFNEEPTCSLSISDGTTLELQRFGNRHVWFTEAIHCEDPCPVGDPGEIYLVFMFRCTEEGVGSCGCSDGGHGGFELLPMWLSANEYAQSPCGNPSQNPGNEASLQTEQCSPFSLMFTWTTNLTFWLGCCTDLDCDDPGSFPNPWEWKLTVTQ
jgi:hypothetical protein